MSIADTNNPGKGGVKTLAIRLEPDLHAQLSLIAQLRSSTITDEIRTAIEAHLAIAKQAPELAAQAESVLADIERDAQTRRAAIAEMFGTNPPDPSPTDTGGNATRGRGRSGSTDKTT